MEIEILVDHTYFSVTLNKATVEKWKQFWRQLCDMAYYRKNIVEKLIVLPKSERDTQIYLNGGLKNEKEICFDTVWKEYSYVGNTQVVPELKELYVPCDLFVCPGVWSLMNYCFPNCKIVFW